MSGAGNLDPYMRGMAAGSFLYVVQYQDHFLDTPTLNVIADSSVVITNSSYSDGCNAGNTINMQTVDQQINDNTSLLHVFSAGNSNGVCSSYGAGSQWGNITGGHKQGKNVIATANLFFDASLVGSSSRGPAFDGRIKPDISANGQNQESTDPNNNYQVFGGTSAAAPGIAGIAATMYQAYKMLNGGTNPESALVKAVLLNTANDLGNVGPDFKYGWGHVNALRAAMLIEDGRHLDDNISQGESNTHAINIPAGTQQVRFMLYWNDPAASVGSSPSLVNDLDLTVTDPSTNTLLPWVLDETPNAVTLDLPAVNGDDHLNNVEQVLINNPDAGSYDINISGFDVPFGPQHYFVVYEIISNEITVTYPLGGESFVPGETEVIHWDAYNASGNFDIEYSNDNGSSWNLIASVGETEQLHEWNVPNDISGQCLVRVTNNGNSDTSEENFSIADLVTNVSFSQVCIDEATAGMDLL